MPEERATIADINENTIKKYLRKAVLYVKEYDLELRTTPIEARTRGNCFYKITTKSTVISTEALVPNSLGNPSHVYQQ
ncbi:hypothetical protein FACS1894199_14430 [Bacteroidia bacterium]|nr:hypothetical protein FACS1894199_14430 [Bacteroidia bacterium]